MTVIRVLLVDDHDMLRQGLAAFLASEKDIKVVAEASDGVDVEKILSETAVDVVLIDINMEQQNGIVTTQQIKSLFPDIRVLGLSMHKEDNYIRKLMEEGASGYLIKSSGKDELVEAIRTVYKGNTYLSKEVSQILINSIISPSKATDDIQDYVPLSEREIEILILIADEYTNNEIANKLNLSPRTVDAHRRNLLEKTGSKNTAGLVRFAVERKLL
ncbi:MAG: response regulator [Flavobacteriales bacterium]